MGAIIDLIIQVLAGVGLTVGVEKLLPKENPVNPNTGISTWGPVKIVLFVIFLALGGFILIFVSKKLGLKIFKRK